jgi:hypothetical protein
MEKERFIMVIFLVVVGILEKKSGIGGRESESKEATALILNIDSNPSL